MSFNDNSYGLFQGQLFMQKRSLNGAATGGFIPVGDADKFEITPTQSFDDIKESQTGLRSTAAHIPTGSDIKLKINALWASKAILASGLWGTDTGAVPSGTAVELATAYNNSLVPLANMGVSSVVASLAGVTGVLASVAVLTPGSGYTPNALLPITFTGSPGINGAGFALTNTAGAVVGAYVTVAGSGYVAPTATIAGGGTGATFQVNMGAALLVSGTDYTADLVNGSLTILPGSKLVPSFTNTFGVAPVGAGGVGISTAYSYAAYTGKVEAFTSGIQYYTLRLQGINVANGQAILVNVYQAALDMTKLLSLIDAKHNNVELDGMCLQDTTRPVPTVAAPYSQFFNIVKA